MQLSNLIECKAFWERIHASEQFDIGPSKPTSPPAEMPEVEPDPQDAIAHGAPMPLTAKVPVVLGYCMRFLRDVGKKGANSCVGCTVTCPGKGKQEPPDEGLEPQEPTDEQKEEARLAQERMDAKL
jgi:hypothetical protein